MLRCCRHADRLSKIIAVVILGIPLGLRSVAVLAHGCIPIGNQILGS
jgi:uncharacterized membrane protein YccF (DUF307 family)